jgi:hypothetical protein
MSVYHDDHHIIMPTAVQCLQNIDSYQNVVNLQGFSTDC